MRTVRDGFILLFILLSLCVFPLRASAADGVPLSDIGGPEAAEAGSVYDELPEGHWVYRAVERLAGTGLLDDRWGESIDPNQPLTTYELAVIVGDMVNTYNSVSETGLPPSALRPAAPEYDAPIEEEIEAEAVPEPPSTIILAQVLETPILETVTRPPRVQKKTTSENKDETPPEVGEAWLEFSDEARAARPAPVVVKLKRGAGPALIQEVKKEDKKKEEEKKEEKPKEEKEKPKEKLPKELKGLEKKKLDLTDKDIIILQELVDFVNAEFKKSDADIKKLKADLKKDLQEVKKVSGKNTSDIENLKQENQRFKVTGSGTMTIRSSGDLNGDTSVGISSGTSFDVYSKPRKFQDMVLRTNLSGSYADIRYQNFERKNRNFMARSLNFGPVSPSYSVLTVFGKSLTGHTGEFLLNDYTIKYHYGTPGSSTYTYGASLQSSVFGEARSLAYLSRILIYEDASVKDNCMVEVSGVKYWGTWSGSTLCIPPYKNSVTSLFIRYPLTDRITLTTEYAHSTFFREGFNAMFGEGSPTFTDMTKKYQSDSSGWRPIPELRDQDDAYIFFLDFAKDSLTIFPLGYAKLGKGFASKYAAFDSLGGDNLSLGGTLPINIQGLEAFIARGTLDKRKQNYKLDFMAVHIRETEPTLLKDLSAMPSSVQTFVKVDQFPKRTNEGLLSFRVFQNKLTYYLSNRMTMSYDYMYGRGGLGPDCLDGDLLFIYDDKGNIIDKVIGNGIRDCSIDNQKNDTPLSVKATIKNQTYNLWMRTSKRGEYTLTYKSEELLLALGFGEDSSAQTIRAAFESLAPFGTEYSLNNKLTYRLTDVSSLEFWFNYKFGRPSKARVKDDTSQDVGMTVNMSF